MAKTIDIDCGGYSVKTDIYEGSPAGPVLLSLIGRTSRRTKQRYIDFFPKLAKDLGITVVVFDYSGHGDSPFELDDTRPAQHFLEVVNVFDWMKDNYPDRKFFVIGSSYGGFLATQLTKYRKFDGLILRAPAIYRPQDFYTLIKNEDRNAIEGLRRDAEALAKHPLLARASDFKGKVLLMVHAKDERVPKETTNAYANAFHPDLIIEDVTHSLDDATDQQIDKYDQDIYDWLKSNA